jgi:uncharacterized protein YcaQ
MHYRGLIRVVRRDAGIRVYEARSATAPAADKAEREARLDALVDVAVRKYAPVPAPSLATLVARLRYAAPQWKGGLKQALRRARARLAHEKIDGVEWYWPAEEAIPSSAPDAVFLLAPFDPVVWDRRRFERLWGWAYRFEAYPVRKRKLFTTRCRCSGATRVGWGTDAKSAVRASFDTSAVSLRSEFTAPSAGVERLRVFDRQA